MPAQDEQPTASMPPPPSRAAMPPPASSGSMPPPPRPSGSSAMPPPDVRRGDLRSAAVHAAVAAATSVAPGQRDRALERAAAAIAAVAAEEAQEAAKAAAASSTAPRASEPSPTDTVPATGSAQAAPSPGSGAPRAAGAPGAAPAASYEAPSWSGVPEGVPYSLEVLKNGTIIENHPVAEKPYYTFGRHPSNDFILEHPSASRLHAVLQYRGSTGEAYLWDSSAHGTWVNKQRVQANTHVLLRVGDTIKFGSSSRLWVLCGPAELLPPEGLTKSQKKQLAQLEYSAKVANKEKEASRKAMEAALSGGATWGMGGPDATEEDDPDAMGDIDWRALLSAGKLTDKQQKLAEKIRQKEYKLTNTQNEMERIQKRERQEGGLTQGQAETLLRLEKNVDKLQEEIEDMDEELQDSIRDSLRARRKAEEGAQGEGTGAGAKKRKKQRGTTASDEEYLEGEDSDDEFFDRTATAGGKRQKGPGGEGGAAGKGKGSGAVQQVESAQSLYGKREVLTSERADLLLAIAEEEKRVATHTDIAHTQPQPMDTDQGTTTGVADGSGQSTPVEPQHSSSTGPSQPSQQQPSTGDVEDSLDAYMTSMEAQLEGDKLKSMRHQLTQIDAQLARVEKLLRIADPDGWLKPGSKAAAAAKELAQRQLEAERKKAAVAALAAKKQAAAAKEPVPSYEEEHEDDDNTNTQNTHTNTDTNADTQQQGGTEGQQAGGKGGAGLTLRAQTAKGKPVQASAQAAAKPAAPKNAAAAAAAASLIAEFSGRGESQAERAGGDADNPARIMPSVLKSRAALPAGSAKAAQDAAAARVAEDLGALSAAERRRRELEELERQEREEAEAAQRLAAERAAKTQALQDKLGY